MKAIIVTYVVCDESEVDLFRTKTPCDCLSIRQTFPHDGIYGDDEEKFLDTAHMYLDKCLKQRKEK